MREIKFRLIKNMEIVGYEVHAIDPNLKAGIGVYHKTLDSPLQAGYPITGGDKHYIFHDRKDQYLGLKDKNGKEIYERDIIVYRTINGIELIAIVVWNAKVCSFQYSYLNIHDQWVSSTLYEFESNSHYEIKGNIHKHPDLIKGNIRKHPDLINQ